jgi:hypothetical protein
MKKLLLALALSLAAGCSEAENNCAPSDSVDVEPSKDTTPSEDTACTGTAKYCQCLDRVSGWANAQDYCACEEERPSGSDYTCECCWIAFDETAPDYNIWNVLVQYCETSSFNNTPEGGCQE